MIKTIKNTGYSQDNALNPMFEDLLNHLPDIFFLFNQDGRFLLWNKKLEQISEYIPDEIPNMHPLDFFSSEDKQLITEKINLAFKDGFASVEKALKTKTGKKIPYLFTASSIYYMQQNCLIGMGVDISSNNEAFNEVRLLLNNTSESFILIGKDFNIKSFNLQFANDFKNFYGYEVQKGSCILDYANPEKRKDLIKVYESVFSGQSIKNDLELDLPSGGQKLYSINYEPAKNDNFEIIGAFITVKDVTSERKALEQLITSERRFRSLVQEGSDLIGILDTKGNFSYVSLTASNILGYEHDEPVGENAFNYIHPEDKEQVLKEYEQVTGSKKVFLSPFRFLAADGSWHWIETILTDMINDPAVNGIVANSRDITEKIIAERNKEHLLLQLSQANERFKKVAEATNDAIWDWDFATGKISWGEGFKTLFDHEPVNHSNINSWMEHVHSDDFHNVEVSLQNTLKNINSTHWQHEYRYLKANGTYAYILDKGSILRDYNGQAYRMIGAMSDITHHKEYESSLKHLNATLEKQSEELLQHINEIEAQNLKLKEIAWIQSHEVRAPLASLMGLVSLFDNNMISEEEKDQLFIKLGNAAKELDQVITSIILKTRLDLSESKRS